MANFNKVILMGNLTRDPELRYLPSGMALARIGMAVNRKYRNRNSQEMVEETTFVDVEGWGQQAETFCRYMSKGRPVFIEGRLKLDSWEGKDGQKRSKLTVVMENFQFLGEGRTSGGGGGPRERAPEGASRGGSVQGAGSGASQVSDGGGGDSGGGGGDYDFDDIPF